MPNKSKITDVLRKRVSKPKAVRITADVLRTYFFIWILLELKQPVSYYHRFCLCQIEN